jgi:hypothetical protein
MPIAKHTKTAAQHLAYAGDLMEAAQRIGRVHSMDGGDMTSCLLGMAAGGAHGCEWTEAEFVKYARGLFVQIGGELAEMGEPS